MSKGRLEAFSDGVFGVAITLLVLDVQPEGGTTGWAILLHQWHHILVFVLSFFIVGVYWVAHHQMLHFIAATNRIFLWLNLMMLLLIVFIPFTASVLSVNHADPSSIRIYAANLILINLTGTSMWAYAARNHRLMHPGVPDSFIRFVIRVHLGPLLIYSTAIALASWNRYVSLALLPIAPAFFTLPNPFLEKHGRHAMEAIREHEKKHPRPPE